MNKEMQFQIEYLASELTEMVMEHYGWDMLKALDTVYSSETFAKVNDPECKLYFQGPVYVFSFLKKEIETGKMG